MPNPTTLRVLLVDDDTTTNYLNQLLLTTTMQVAQQVLVAHNGQEALTVLAEVCPSAASATCPHLILLDLNMPVMNGWEFLQAYQQLPVEQRVGIVVVMLTTSVLERDERLVQGLPIADFIAKPLTRAKVGDLLARYFPATA